MRKPKILFVAPFPPPFSGPEFSAENFANSNVNDEFEIITLNTNFRKSNKDKGKIGMAAFLFFFKFNYSLIRGIIKHKPQIVYYYVTATIKGWLLKDIWLILISKIFRKKIVLHMRAGHFTHNFKSSNFLFKYVIKKFANMADLGLAQSKSLQNQFNGIMDNSKVSFVYNMIDTDKFNPVFIKNGKMEILFLGHLSLSKGYFDVIKIIPAVVEQFPTVKFKFAGTSLTEERNVFHNYVTGEIINHGDFNQLKEIEKRILAKYAANYEYLGNLNEKHKILELNNSQIFVLPSYSEGFSMAVLEAMSMGKPVVTTPVGALSEVVINNQNGYIVNPGNIKQLTEGILNLLKNEETRHLFSKKNRGDVEEKFSIKAVSERYISLFSKLINE